MEERKVLKESIWSVKYSRYTISWKMQNILISLEFVPSAGMPVSSQHGSSSVKFDQFPHKMNSA